MGNGSDGLIMSQARDRVAIDNIEDASFGSGCGVGRLVENLPHLTVAIRGPAAVVQAGALVIAGAWTNGGEEKFRGTKGRCRGGPTAATVVSDPLSDPTHR